MSHYDTLDVPAEASADEIKQAFRRKAQAAHPDKGGSDEAMAALNKAYAVLGDATRRAQYDEDGDESEPTTLAEKAVHYLAGLFSSHLMDDGDILQTVRGQLQGDQKAAKKNIAELGRQVERLTKRRGKVRVKSGDNLVHLLIDGQIGQANAQTVKLNEMLQIFECTGTLLAQYESTEEIVPDSHPGLEDLIAQMMHATQARASGRNAGDFRGRF